MKFAENLKLIMRLTLIGLMLSVTTGCSAISGFVTTDDETEKPKPTKNQGCYVFDIIMASRNDTSQTLNQIDVHNTIYTRLCLPKGLEK